MAPSQALNKYISHPKKKPTNNRKAVLKIIFGLHDVSHFLQYNGSDCYLFCFLRSLSAVQVTMAICVRCARENQTVGVLETECVKMALMAMASANAMKVTMERPVKCVSQEDMEPTVNQVIHG